MAPESRADSSADSPADPSSSAERPAPPTDDLVTTSHTLRTPSGDLAYTATTGRVVLRTEKLDDDGAVIGYEPQAEVFVVAYTLDGADPTTRPLTISFNGGPGSSSVWLHLGLFGPRRVAMGDAGALTGPPWGLVDNPESLLAQSDLLFIDPVSTGWSRATAGRKPADFHGFTADVETVGEVVRLWITRHGRWSSPKFVAGESYGTIRAAALAAHLQERRGLFVNGLMLISSVLDMSTIRFTEGNDTPYALFLPTYAAIAHHHGRHPGRELADVLAEAEEFAAGEYPWALARGHRLPAADRDRIAERVAALTGLDAGYVRRARLRVAEVQFFRELLRADGRTVGRLDGRFSGWEADDTGAVITVDPSYSAILGPYTAAFHSLVRDDLNYANDLPYEVLTDKVHPWSYREFEGRGVSAVGELARAMRSNPHLRVHVALGHLDGATPYFAAEHVLAHLPLPDELLARIETAYYPAGHMMYVHQPTRVAQSADLAAFVTSIG